MAELFVNPKIDWIAAKKYFIGLTIALLVAGAVSVVVRGFKLGIDFTGGMLMTVRFKEPHSPGQIRDVLGRGGVDTSKVTIVNDASNPNNKIIRAPVSGDEDQTERQVIRALQTLNPSAEAAAGKDNINSIDAPGIEQDLRRSDPLDISNRNFGAPHPYTQVANEIISFRDGPQKGFISDMSILGQAPLSLQGISASDLNFDQSKVRAALLSDFYAGKIDLNLVGEGELTEALKRIDPEKIGGQSTADQTYSVAAAAIVKHRNNSEGVINDLSDLQLKDVSADLLEKMQPYFAAGDWAVAESELVGPQVSHDLRDRAIYVTLAACAGMLVYIAFRFEWIYGLAAVLAVFHDTMITLGIFSLIQQEVSLTVVAAVLTLVGYSMNDTIVVFDRIRENLRLRRRDSLVQITNDSINQTLSRTVIAAGLTFLSVLSILALGGQVLRGFSLALTIGILIGTYSSIAVASPIMLWWQYLTSGKGMHGRGMGRPAKVRAQQERTLAKV
ncbi:MAG TPA: protein translocase subunit SecF [Blastocatellia bacterium]